MAFFNKIKSFLKSNRSCQENPLYKNALTLKEVNALRYYTNSGAYEINKKLRDIPEELLDKDTKEKAALISSAISKFPRYPGTVYRKVDLTKMEEDYGKQAVNDFIRNHSAGQTVTYPSFTSTSKTPKSFNLPKRHKQAILIIKEETGKDISNFSRFKEDEVLLDRNFSARINRSEYDKSRNQFIIEMEQIKRRENERY